MVERHLLEIYEPYEYEGPNPVPVSGDCLVRGPDGAWYYLVSVATDIEVDSDPLTQLLVLPRYNMDSIARAERSACTVNISRVRPGARLEPNRTFSYEDVQHWGVGKITPAGAH